MFCRQGLYPIVRKVSLLTYELDIPPDSCIHLIVSIIYLIRYRSYKDIFGRTSPPPRPVEAGTDTDTSDDDARDGKHWELKRIVDHETKRGKTVSCLLEGIRAERG